MISVCSCRSAVRAGLLLACWCCLVLPLVAQPAPVLPPAPSPTAPSAPATTPSAMPAPSADSSPSAEDRGPLISDSTVGYIDGAIPGNVLRLRVDAAYGDNDPSRGAFFYARSPSRPTDKVETNIDYQEISAYGEYCLNKRFSVFVEVPYMFLDPTVDPNAKGLADMNCGFRWAFIYENDLVTTFQLRAYIPTGNGDLGLGTSHPSLEPAFLAYYRLTERCSAESELRLWIPLGDSPAEVGSANGGSADFYSYVIRYGVGVHYDLIKTPGLVVAPVTEVVGWTFLGGKSTIALPDGGGEDVSANGDTIVNLKLGVRFKVPDVGDFYVGYGKALTGDVLYKDIIRAEVRLTF